MSYRDAYAAWKSDPDGFWMEAAGAIDWTTKPTKALHGGGPAGNDWFADEVVAALFVVMVVGGVLTFWRSFTRENPVVDFSAFADTNFAVGSV